MEQPFPKCLLGKGLVAEKPLLSADMGKLKRATLEGNYWVECSWYK